MRGILIPIVFILIPVGIIPAHAGNTKIAKESPTTAEDHPRLRGEHLLFIHSFDNPHGIIPACAGNTFQTLQICSRERDHPRLRGEHSFTLQNSLYALGSSPLARGTLYDLIRFAVCTGIIPACAGNTLKKSLFYSLFSVPLPKFHSVSHTPETL